MSKFKVGDSVRVIDLEPSDPFEIGDVVKVVNGSDGLYSVKKEGQDSWWMIEEELELVRRETFTISEALKLAIDGHKLTNDKIGDFKTKYIFFDGTNFMYQGDKLEKAWAVLLIKDGWYLLEEPKAPFDPKFAKGEFFANTTGDFGKVLDILESSYLVTFNGRTKIKYKEEQMVKLEESK